MTAPDLREEALPAAFVDLDALDHNVAVVVGRAGAVPIRVATKSVRCPELLRRVIEQGKGQIRGLMTWSAEESALLVREGFDDLLLAYPVARPFEARLLAGLVDGGARVVPTVDRAEHVALLAEHAGNRPFEVCLDVDASWRPAGLHLGVRRSPVRTVDDARRVGEAVQRTDGRVRLTAVMAYEAQIAGMTDVNPGSRALDPVRRWIKVRSAPAVAALRRDVVAALRADGHEISVVNGGGTGSLHTTSADGTVTEVTAGSGFFAPHLFDRYRGLALRPAAFFALPVVRSSDPGLVTCLSGGWLASGEIGGDRAPIVHSPAGWSPLSLEGWGEVQTPLRASPGASPLVAGDTVVARHAKAGELLEHFAEVLLVTGDRVVGRAKTMRGLGCRFG